MIADTNVLAEIRQQWSAVKRLCDDGARVVFVEGVQFCEEGRPSESFNLPFVLAFAVLDQVLCELRDQGVFSCPSKALLGTKMDKSKSALPWQDYALVEQAKVDRNRIAHDGVLFSKADCLKYVGAVEAELKAWGIV